jgi:hypothetical protein
MDSECTICKCEMSAEGFKDTATEGLEGDCYRLKCKHAFHAHCLVQSLRFGNNLCPVCRNNGGSSGTQTANVTVTIHRNEENFEIQVQNFHEEEDAASMNSAYIRYEEYEMNPIISQIRSSHRPTQISRSNLRRALGRYNVWRDSLRADRRRRLQETMSRFRRERYHEFVSRMEDVHQAFETAQRIERAEYATRSPAPLPLFDITPRDLVIERPAEFGEYSTRRHDPCNRRFWSY